MMEIFDKKGWSIPLSKFTELFEDFNYRSVRYTKLKDGMISTVWLGISHGASPSGPLIFETLETTGDEEMTYRFSTIEQAIKHHELLVEQHEKNLGLSNRFDMLIEDL